MVELWIPIEGYENYIISNLGHVMNITTGKILKQHNNGRGYSHVVLYDNMHCGKTIMVHRLVAKTFIPNPNNLPQVNHIDENKLNNCVSNLEWITSIDNINHGTHNIRVGMNNPNRKPIYSVTSLGEVTFFDSARAAVKYYNKIGIDVKVSGISQAITGKIDTYKNLAWYPQSDESGITGYHKKFNYDKKHKNKNIYSVSNNGIINYFSSMQSALQFYNLPRYQSVYLKFALDNKTEFNGMKWFYNE